MFSSSKSHHVSRRDGDFQDTISEVKDELPTDQSSASTTLAWILCSVCSLTTTKYLLTSINYHYPLHLLLLQILPTLAILIVWEIVTSIARPLRLHPVSTPRAEEHSQLGARSLFTASIACTALSWPLLYQAVLHLPNLPTLVMLSPIALLVEVILTRPWTKEDTAPKSYAIRFCCFSFAILTLLYDEYRLTINGLLFAIPAMLLAGIARAAYCLQLPNGSSRSQHSRSWKTYLFATILSSVAITAPWAHYMESVTLSLESFVPLLCLNVASSAISIIIGGHPCTQIGTAQPIAVVKRGATCFINSPALSTFSVAAFVGFMSVRSPLPPCSSLFQILAFIVATICFLDWYQPAVKQDQETSVGLDGTLRETNASSHPLIVTDDTLGTPHEVRDDRIYSLSSTRTSPRLISHGAWLLILAIAIIAYLIFTALNISAIIPPNQLSQPSAFNTVNTTTSAATTLDIVLSTYDESFTTITQTLALLFSIPSIASLKPRIILYTKLASPGDSYISSLQIATDASKIIPLANIGREGHTYLTHMLTHWDDLASQTLFLQAHSHNTWSMRRRIDNFFVPGQTGMLSLGFNGGVCEFPSSFSSSALPCGDRWGWQDEEGWVGRVIRARESGATVSGDEEGNATITTTASIHQEVAGHREVVPLTYKGQFIVSSTRIRSAGREILETLLARLVDAEQEEDLSSPVFGYTLERLWGVLFGCTDSEVASRCPSLLSGWRRWGQVSDCQCLD